MGSLPILLKNQREFIARDSWMAVTRYLKKYVAFAEG